MSAAAAKAQRTIVLRLSVYICRSCLLVFLREKDAHEREREQRGSRQAPQTRVYNCCSPPAKVCVWRRRRRSNVPPFASLCPPNIEWTRTFYIDAWLCCPKSPCGRRGGGCNYGHIVMLRNKRGGETKKGKRTPTYIGTFERGRLLLGDDDRHCESPLANIGFYS